MQEPQSRSRKEILQAEALATQHKLGLENSPLRWQGGHDGWCWGKKYIKAQNSKAWPMRLVGVNNWPTRISTLPPQAQLMAYEKLSKTSRPDQDAAYYKLHCQQLNNVRCRIAYQLSIHEKENQQSQQMLRSFIVRKDRAIPCTESKETAHKKSTHKNFHARESQRAFARGLEVLIEKCEVRLQKNKDFTLADWRSYKERPRWIDGKKGWTGLKPEEIENRNVKAARSDGYGLMEIRSEKLQAGLMARYARMFPRAVDRRLAKYVFEHREGEGVRAARHKLAKVILS